MELNQNFKIKMRRVLFHLDSPIQLGSQSLFQYCAEPARFFTGILKRISFTGLFGSTPQVFDDPAFNESNRLAYEIKQTLGIKGFVLNMAGSASLATGLPACWDAVRPCLETPALEVAAAQIVTEASSLAEALGESTHNSSLRLSHEGAAHLQVGLDFYHFLLPKLLVLTSALHMACDQELLRRGIVEGRAPEKEAVGEDGLHNLFPSIRQVLVLSDAQGAVETPRAWSKYLAAASAELKPIVQGKNFNRAAKQLYKISRQSAPGFQGHISPVAPDSLDGIDKEVTKLETFLPSLIMSITLMQLYFRPSDRVGAAHPAPSQPILKGSREISRPGHVTDRPVMGVPTVIPCPI